MSSGERGEVGPHMADRKKPGKTGGPPASDDAAARPDDAWFAGEAASPRTPPAHEPTVFQGPPESSWGGDPPPVPPPADIPTGPMPDQGHLRPGVVLNHIYEVHRFIARGGMGEVYEGINVATDERVAIKVILQNLMGDPNVHALFRKEARTLTRLNHPALVQYRLLAQEPQLGVFYIVTEFVDGISLSDALPDLRPFLDDLKLLARRLAEGLRAAHALGAVHRDISPDNILLQHGRVAEAKIIDFGISKDLDGPAVTIVSGGFAGKLGYVAPEQFGDFGGEIGPWTDVYSLALVLLAVAGGRPPDMGTTLVDAVDRRRQGPDVSAAPEALQPLLRRMLVADPAHRLRSMDEVLLGLDGVLPPAAQQGGPTAPPLPPLDRAGFSDRRRLPRSWLIYGGGGILAGVVAVAAIIGLAARSPRPATPASPAPPPVAATAPEPVTASVQATLETAMAGLPCAWVEATASGGAITLRGAAGSPERAEQALRDALTAKGLTAPTFENRLAPLQPAACPVVETLHRYRAPVDPADPWLRMAPQIALARQPKTCNRQSTYASVDLSLKPVSGGADDLQLVGLDTAGNLQSLFVGMTELRKLADGPHADITPSQATINSCDFEAGDKAFVVIHGANLTAAGMDADHPKPADPDFPRRFAALADANHWRVQMSWYRVAPAE
jgi:hypothetical protein